MRSRRWKRSTNWMWSFDNVAQRGTPRPQANIGARHDAPRQCKDKRSISPCFQLEHANYLRKPRSLIAQLGCGEFRLADNRRILLGRFTDLRDSEIDLLDAARLLA